MLTSPLDSGTVQAALELAARAPSVHNSQPWRWRLDGEVISLRADLRRWLPLTDPDGRDLVLSCGAALHHLQVALAALGVPATVIRMPDPDEPDLLASVRPGAPLDAPGATDAAAALQARRSDRRRYSDWPVEQIQLAELSAAAAAYGAVLRVVPDGPARRALDEALRLASAAHAATTGYDTELSLWSGLLAGDEGVPARNVPATGGPRRFAGTGDLPEGAPIDGAVLLVLGTSSDDQLSWLRAGEAMSAVLLAATALGLASCPLSEPLELEGTRALVRDQVLDGTLSPQIVLRVGWAPVGDPLPATPRRRLADQTD